MSDSTPYNMPKEPGRWRAIFMATLVHAILFGLLWFGIRWQSETPIAVEAEVWNMQAREATPEPEPRLRPEPQPEVKPEPKPVIREAPKPPVVEQPVDTPDIVLEQEKKRIEEKKRLDDENRKEKERQERERQQKIAEEKKIEETRLEQERREKLAAATKLAEVEELKQKQVAEKAAADKVRQEQIAAEKIVEEKRIAARKLAEAEELKKKRAAEKVAAEKLRQEQIAAEQKANTIFNISDAVRGNPPVEYEVQLLPDGSLRSVRKVKSSGVPGFDEAVARAIERSSPFPPDRTGAVPTSFNLIHRPRDQ